MFPFKKNGTANRAVKAITCSLVGAGDRTVQSEEWALFVRRGPVQGFKNPQTKKLR